MQLQKILMENQLLSKYFMLGCQVIKDSRNLKATSKGQRLAQIMLNTNLTKYNI